MKASHIAVGVVGLAVAGLWYFAGGSAPPPAQAAEQLRVSDPLTHENLTCYFVHGPDAVDDSRVVSLQEALERGWAVVHETGNVNTLMIENRSADHELFVQSGDLIRGGRQDRMIATDMLLPSNSGKVPFPAHCVEQGRWTGRGNEASGHFATSNNCAVGKNLKLANASGNQAEVWNEVRGNQQKLNDNLKTVVNCPDSPTSFQLTLENRTVQQRVADYEKTLRNAGRKEGVVGVVFVVNGEITGAEVYGSSGLFRKAWPKLLRSAAVEALAERPKDTTVACTRQKVEQFLVAAAEPPPAAERVAADEPAIRGRSGATGNRLLREGGGNEGVPAQQQEALVEGNVDGRAVQTGRQAANPAPNVNPSAPRLRQQFGSGRNNDNVAMGNAMPRPGQQGGQPDGNRLNVNRLDNASAVMIESRPVAQPGAVIHRSYIAK